MLKQTAQIRSAENVQPVDVSPNCVLHTSFLKRYSGRYLGIVVACVVFCLASCSSKPGPQDLPPRELTDTEIFQLPVNYQDIDDDADASDVDAQNRASALAAAIAAERGGRLVSYNQPEDWGNLSESDRQAQELARSIEMEAEESARRLEARIRAWPSLRSLITSPFGEKRGGPMYGNVCYRHAGLDLRARLGWPICALQGGVVVQAGPRGIAGIAVEIRQDNGKTAIYAHMARTFVKEGGRVETGQHIGLVGCTGRTTGAHLHIAMRNKAGGLINPRKEIKGPWELFDPPLRDIGNLGDGQSCAGRRDAFTEKPAAGKKSGKKGSRWDSGSSRTGRDSSPRTGKKQSAQKSPSKSGWRASEQKRSGDWRSASHSGKTHSSGSQSKKSGGNGKKRTK